MSRYRLIEYEVWGNEKDGYEVNQALTTSTYYELDENTLWYGDVIAALKKQGCFKKYVRAKSIEIDGDNDTLYFYYKGRPEFELRKEQ